MEKTPSCVSCNHEMCWGVNVKDSAIASFCTNPKCQFKGLLQVGKEKLDKAKE